MGNEEEEVEEEKAICMEKAVPHTFWDTRRARGAPEKAFLGVCGWIRMQLFASPPARQLSQEVWGTSMVFSTLAALPGSNNVLGLWGEGFLEAPAEAPWALLGGSWERF